MRVTNVMTARISVNQMNESRAKLARIQEQASSGLRINRPSDDSVGYQNALRLDGSIGQTESFLRSIDASRVRMGTTENALADAADLISQAEVTAIEGANSTNGPETYAILKLEIESIFESLVDRANAQSAEGAYVFAGDASEAPAFSTSGPFVSGNPPPTVAFEGLANAVSVEIDRDVFIPVTLDGSAVFEGAAGAFEGLRSLWTGLDQNDPDAVRASIDELGAAREQLLAARSEIGTSGATANRVEDSLTVRREELTERLSITEDADVFDVYSRLAQQETSLQATLQISSNLLSQTLLDFI